MKFHTARWLILLPAAVLAWYSVFVCSLLAYSYIDRDLCPPEDVVSGFCTNGTIRMVLSVVEHVGVGTSAVAVLAMSTAVAPSHKRLVLSLGLVVGLAVAAALGFSAEAWSLLAAAAAGGVLAAIAIARKLRGQAANNSSKPTPLRGAA